ncbi:MAG: GspH/FimT family pseudopilin [Burkholderiaceae bacterium]|nr:GspH/FimT family pseudopilin [Burkholderiaceae bacterium]
MKKPATRATGFTLIELMIVIVLAAVLVMLAMPSFTGLMQRYRVSIAATKIGNLLRFARIEAMRTHQIVTVAQTGTPDTGCDTASDEMDWHCGVDVYVAKNDNGGTQGPTIKAIPTSSLDSVKVQIQAPAISYNTMGVGSTAQKTGGAGNFGASILMIYVWPTALGADPSVVTAPLVNTVCALGGGKVRVVPQYVAIGNPNLCTN